MNDTSFTYSQQLMGTTVSLQLLTENLQAVAAVFNTIKALETRLTVNRDHSEVMSVNHGDVDFQQQENIKFAVD